MIAYFLGTRVTGETPGEKRRMREREKITEGEERSTLMKGRKDGGG